MRTFQPDPASWPRPDVCITCVQVKDSDTGEPDSQEEDGNKEYFDLIQPADLGLIVWTKCIQVEDSAMG